MNKKRTIHNAEEDPRYHDTWKLLKRYGENSSRSLFRQGIAGHQQVQLVCF